MPLVELRSKFLTLSSPEIFSFLLAKLKESRSLIIEGTHMTLPGRQPQLTRREGEIRDQIESIFLKAGVTPPLEEEVQRPLKAEPVVFKKTLHSLYQEQKLVRLIEKVTLHYLVWEKVDKFVLNYLKAKGKITIAKLRDELEITRKYACAILEFMDRRGLTRRIGDEHRLK